MYRTSSVVPVILAVFIESSLYVFSISVVFFDLVTKGWILTSAYVRIQSVLVFTYISVYVVTSILIYRASSILLIVVFKESCLHVFPFRVVFFDLVTTGWILTSTYVRYTNQ